MNLFARLGLYCALFALLPACIGKTTYQHVFQPTSTPKVGMVTAQACKGDSGSGGGVLGSCGINQYTACPEAWTLEDLAGEPPEVGSDRIHDPGTEPVPC